MADRLSLFPEEDNTGLPNLFSFSGQGTVDRDTYQTQNVNYYTTALGLPTLEEESGIEVEVPEDITELATPGRSPEKDDRDDTPRVLEPMSIITKDIIEGGEIKFSEDAMTGAGFSFSPQSSQFNSYSDYLKSSAAKDAGVSDRISFTEGILEPLLDPEKSIKDIKIGQVTAETAKTSVEKVGEGIKEAPSRFERLIDGELTAQDSAALAKGLMATAGPAGLAAGMFIGGKTVRNAFGRPSFMPNGLLGGIADVVHTLQFRDMAANRALKNSLIAVAGDNPDSTAPFSFKDVDVGFEMLMGNMGITRGHGSGTYSGNMQGLSHEQVKSLEAISKGYDPRGYNMFEPTKSRSNVVADGGMFVSDNPLDGFFRGNGTYYDPRRFSSGTFSTEATSVRAAASVGLSHTQFKNALGIARSGTKTLSQAIADIKATMVVTTDESKDPTTTTPVNQFVSGDGPGEGGDQGVNENIPQSRDFSTPSGMQAAYEQEAFGGGSSSSSFGSRDTQSGATGGGFGGGFGDRDRFRAKGGVVGYAPGGAVAQGGSGFINRPPEQVSEAESVADNQPDAVPEGTFIINAAAVEFAGSDDIRKMLVTAHKEAIRRGITVDKDGKGAKLIDVALSSGEVKIAPYLAKIIGYDRLEKINNRGKPEVEERIRENGQDAPPGTMMASLGGFLSQGFGQQRAIPQVTAPQEPSAAIPPPTPESYGNEQPPRQGFVERPDVGADVSDVELQAPPEFVSQLEEHYKKPVTRTRNEKLYKNMSDTQLLAHMIMAETKSSVAPERAMYAVGNTVLHRVASNRPEFKKQTSPRDVILKRLSKGAYEYVGMDVTRNKGLKKNFVDNRESYEKGLARATAVAEDLLSGEMEGSPAVSSDVMWYTKKDAPNQWMRENLILVETIGEHEFYKAPD